MDSRLCSRSYQPHQSYKHDPEPTHNSLTEQDPPPDDPPTDTPSNDEIYPNEFVNERKRLRKIRKALRSKSAYKTN